MKKRKLTLDNDKYPVDKLAGDLINIIDMQSDVTRVTFINLKRTIKGVHLAVKLTSLFGQHNSPGHPIRCTMIGGLVLELTTEDMMFKPGLSSLINERDIILIDDEESPGQNTDEACRVINESYEPRSLTIVTLSAGANSAYL